jgi:hypothetical protein
MQRLISVACLVQRAWFRNGFRWRQDGRLYHRLPSQDRHIVRDMPRCNLLRDQLGLLVQPSDAARLGSLVCA